MKKSWVHKTLKLCISFVWPWILCMLLKTCRTSFWWCFSDYTPGQPDSWSDGAGRGPTSHKVRDITLYYPTILSYTVKQLQTSQWWSLCFHMQLSRGQYDEVFRCRISEIPSLVQLCPAVLSGQDQQHRHVMPILGKWEEREREGGTKTLKVFLCFSCWLGAARSVVRGFGWSP